MSRDSSQEQNLMLGDRLNWSYILGNAVLKFHAAIVQIEGSQSEQEVRESSLVIFYSFPDKWLIKDKQLHEDLKNSVEMVKVDVRKEWCGRKVGKSRYEMRSVLQPYRLYNACVNVMDRRGLLSKTIYEEKIVPAPEDDMQEEEKPLTDEDQKTLVDLKNKVGAV